MVPSILSIGTALPETRLGQDATRDLFASQPGLDRRTQRIIHAAFDASAIDTRHTVLPELAGLPASGLRVRDARGALLAPTTGARNDEYRRSAPALFAAAATDALAGAGLAPGTVTHVVTISCTGLFAPGPDYRLVRDLGLRADVQRYNLGFVGCAAAVPGLRLAAHIAASDPTAVVLVVSAELCSLHLRSSSDPEQIVASSVFADGAAAAVVTADPAHEALDRLELDGFGTQLIPDGEKDMFWTIGDTGFEMTLTAQVPRLVGLHARTAMPDLLGPSAGIDAWAIHPGGRSILDRVEGALGAPDGALDASRDVLRTHGNMSSATILFVLDELWTRGTVDGARIGLMAFGPGLTVEAARLVRRGARQPRELSEPRVRETVAG
ncbi:type III polyketide synthase [Planococcus sp. APC 4015]|nr:type III polyketide synthase [Planococcus sp. APC 4015]